MDVMVVGKSKHFKELTGAVTSFSVQDILAVVILVPGLKVLFD